MNFSDSNDKHAETALNGTDTGAVLAHEAGLPFQPPLGNSSGAEPFTEWLDLMEVVQMLCPVWPVRNVPIQGLHWRI